jgi:hypothetical protein
MTASSISSRPWPNSRTWSCDILGPLGRACRQVDVMLPAQKTPLSTGQIFGDVSGTLT